MDEHVVHLLEDIAESLRDISATNRAHWRSYIMLADEQRERQADIDRRAEKLEAATLRRAEETHESHELGMAMLGARTPDVIPTELLNREQRRAHRKRS
jgi:hypothetical protein